MVSDHGNIKNTKTGRILKPVKNSTGHYCVNLLDHGQPRSFAVYRLVALNFVDNPFHNSCVHHIDKDLSNNHFTNLIWIEHLNYITRKPRQTTIKPKPPKEVFKKIDGYDYYYVSNYGRVISHHGEISQLPIYIIKKCCYVRLWITTVNTYVSVCKLVANHFLNNYENKYIHHIDGNFKNNRVSNLKLSDEYELIESNGTNPNQHKTPHIPNQIDNAILKFESRLKLNNTNFD